MIPTSMTVTFTNRNTGANPRRNRADTREIDPNSGTSTVVNPAKQCKEVPSINPTAGMPPNICARLEGTNPNHAIDGKTSGNVSVRTIGNASIIPGTNAAATMDTASRKIDFVRVLAVGTGFASTRSQS